MGNFVQGAMQNALSIQTNPAAHMGNAQKAFAASGNLALKLTALIDQEEINRQNHQLKLADQIQVGERNLEMARHNKAAEGNTAAGLAERVRHNNKLETPNALSHISFHI